MHRKTVLILGASYYQIDTINTAKRLGYKVITTDNSAASPGHALADESFVVDTTDKDGILNLAITHRIDGIISPATDVAVPTVAFVSEKLGLSGPPTIAAEMVCDKEQFRQFQIDHQLPAPRRISEADLKNSSFDVSLQLPIIVKPSRSSGGKGVFILSDVAEIYTHIVEATEMSTNKQFILEEFIEGVQGTAEGFMVDGSIDALFVMDRQTKKPPYVTTAGHQIPTELPKISVEELSKQILSIWKNLKYDNGPFDCDFVVHDSTIYILEITPRIGGNSIPRLLNYVAEFDIIEKSLMLACGESVSTTEHISFQPHALMIFGIDRAGKFVYDENQLSELRQENWVRNLELDFDQGADVQPFVNSRNRVGECIVSGNDRVEVQARVKEIYRRLNLRVQS